MRVVDQTAAAPTLVTLYGAVPLAEPLPRALDDALLADPRWFQTLPDLEPPASWPSAWGLLTIRRVDPQGERSIGQVFPFLPDATPLARHRASRWCVWNREGKLLHEASSDVIDLQWSGAESIELAPTATGYRIGLGATTAAFDTTADAGCLAAIGTRLWMVVLHDGHDNIGVDLLELGARAIARVVAGLRIDSIEHGVLSADERWLACPIHDDDGLACTVVDIARRLATTHRLDDHDGELSLSFDAEGALSVAGKPLRPARRS